MARALLSQRDVPRAGVAPEAIAASGLGPVGRRVEADARSLPRRLGAATETQLEVLAKELDRTHPGAAASLREGLAETLTVLRLNLSPTLARTLRSTNSIESMISIARTHPTNVKDWQNGNMALPGAPSG